MSKIEEMAEKAFPFGTEYSSLCRRSGYIKGANAVLREIENVLYNPITPYQLYNDLDKLVKELKGE